MSRKTNIDKTLIDDPYKLTNENTALANGNTFADDNVVLSLILKNSIENILIVDQDLQIQVFNESSRTCYLKLLHIELEKGLSALALVPSAIKDSRHSLYQDAFSGKYCKSESQYILANGESYHLSTSLQPLKSDNGEIVAVLVIESPIHKKEEEDQYKLLFQCNPLPMWTCDIESGKILEVNSAAIAHYGYSEAEFLEMLPDDLHPAEDRALLKLLEEKSSQSQFIKEQVRHQKKNGQIIYVDLTSHVFETGSKKFYLVISQDVTEKMNAEQRLQFSETKYRTLFENNPLPSWIYDIVTEQFLEVNHAAVAQYGYTKEEFLQLTISDLNPDEEKGAAHKSVENVVFTSSDFSTSRHLSKNGQTLFVDVSSSEISYKNRKARLVVVHDKTAQVLAEKKLRTSNERFRLASLASSQILWEWNIQTDNLYLSDAYTTIFGWVANEKKFSDLPYHIHPDDRQQTMREIHSFIANGSVDRWSIEYRHLRSDGSYAFVRDKAFILRGADKKAIKVVGAIEDITKQKETEETIRSSNERFEIASKATSDAIWDMDLSNNNIIWGEGIYALFGYAPDEVTFERWTNLIHPKDAERVQSSLINSIYHSEDNIWRSSYRFLAANSSYRYVLNRSFILRNENGKPYRIIGSLQDISDLKEKEKELLKSNDRYKYATLATSEIIIDWNLKKSKILLSDNFNKIFGWSLPADKQLPYDEFVIHTHPDDVDKAWSDAFRAIQKPDCNLWSSIFRYGKSNGSYSIISFKGYIIRNGNGEALRMIGAIQDITDKTLREQQLTESKERFEAVLKATHDLIWDWNLETGEFYRDPEGVKKVYGVSNEESIKNIHLWLQRLHPEDYDHIKQIIHEILHATVEDTFELEYRFQRDDGNYNHVYDRGQLIRNKEGAPIRFIGAAQDITERKRLEKELLHRELDKQKLISQATIETQELERSEIGKELHDNVNQVLTTTKLYLDLSLSNNDMKDEFIAKSSKNINYVINEIRQLSRSLMNPSLGDLGLHESIKDLIEDIHLTGKIKVALQSDPNIEKILNENQKLMVYRIVQEALNNAIKHAKAKNVLIKVLDIDQSIELSIADDGIGFNFEAVKKGAGLKHIQNRVYLASGSLSVHSVPNEGSNIIIKFPNTIN